MLGAQQAVEDLLHHDGVEFDELGQGLDHLFLRGRVERGGDDELEGPTGHLLPGEASKPHDTFPAPKAAAYLWWTVSPSFPSIGGKVSLAPESLETQAYRDPATGGGCPIGQGRWCVHSGSHTGAVPEPEMGLETCSRARGTTAARRARRRASLPPRPLATPQGVARRARRHASLPSPASGHTPWGGWPPPRPCPTFSSPLSTGMRKRTSGSRLWYRSRTRFTSSGDGGTSGRQRRAVGVTGRGQRRKHMGGGFAGMGKGQCNSRAGSPAPPSLMWLPWLFSTVRTRDWKFTGALAGEEQAGGRVGGRAGGTFVGEAVQAAGDQRLRPLGAVFH